MRRDQGHNTGASKAHVPDRTIARLPLMLTPAGFAKGSSLAPARVKRRQAGTGRGGPPTFRADTAFSHVRNHGNLLVQAG